MASAHVTLSVVSHGQNILLASLLKDIQRFCPAVKVIVTENVADAHSLIGQFTAIHNTAPKGFGANHNAAFKHCETRFFCVANPDIRLHCDPFSRLATTLSETGAGVVGPLVRSPVGEIEDSARRFPTPGLLMRKALGGVPELDYRTDAGPLDVDWVGGMFMLFSTEAFRQIQGFDERYFLYYEDVDICRRLSRGGKRVVFEPRCEVVHDARRGSRRNLRLALHHAKSAVRFFLRG